jgi:membrane associated rhomboid family serine protease
MSLTLILVILTAIISIQAFSNEDMQRKLLFHPLSIAEFGQWYRFFSHGLVHAGWDHLLINMFVLYQFGQIVEGAFLSIFGILTGKIVFIIFYFLAIAIASVPSYFKHRNNSWYAALGASGATSALVFCYIFFEPWGWFLFPPLPAILFGVVYLWYSSYMGKRGYDNIGHDAHFYGAVFGIGFMILSGLIFRPGLLLYFVQKILSGPTPPPFF